MRIVRTVRELRAALAEARAAHSGAVRGGVHRVGMVPTMGALHEGHLSLVRAARAENDTVVLSIFVNPTQFTEAADLAAYPRQEERDAALAAGAGVDVIFAPEAEEMYPAGFATTVRVAGPLTETLEGAARGAAHFDGVATVVSKLLLAALPDAAYFGQKDAQQLLVVRRMVADLGIPSRIVGCPTSRDPDGLARSSRNVRLSAEERGRALAIPRALEAAARALRGGARDAAAVRAAAEAELAAAGIAAEYVAVVHPESLEPLERLDGTALLAIAARVGGVRLIDNALLGEPAAAGPGAVGQAHPARPAGLSASAAPADPPAAGAKPTQRTDP
ncbi:pantoate--beta-alanine ligase [Leucobacter massiliensis]|uniref:Pantothenate synthetase n=1 Tax=Leucobacter massiliensis TaxID=1686285 RepID=A0A2S9QN28_9MICO|nr:pantoate--beta-alanine ligase [Leucobacter massiliensis]PRI10977.1 pantoate--beta-alanine ligase [Leucobacter massiliensis]